LRGFGPFNGFNPQTVFFVLMGSVMLRNHY
jgi:hypothetical protein